MEEASEREQVKHLGSYIITCPDGLWQRCCDGIFLKHIQILTNEMSYFLHANEYESSFHHLSDPMSACTDILHITASNLILKR